MPKCEVIDLSDTDFDGDQFGLQLLTCHFCKLQTSYKAAQSLKLCLAPQFWRRKEREKEIRLMHKLTYWHGC